MRSHGLRTYLTLGALTASVIAAGTTPARADSLALDRFEPGFAGDRMFGVASPYSAGGDMPTLHTMILFDYARDPLVLRTTGGKALGKVVENQLFVHLNTTVALFGRVAINVEIPVAMEQDGKSPAVGDQTFVSPSAAQFGDVRLGARVTILGSYQDAFQLGVGGYVWLPTSAPSSFVTDESVRGMPQLLLGGRTDRIVWSFAGGPEIRRSHSYASTPQGSMLRWGGGIGLLLGAQRQLQIGPEVSAALLLAEVSARTTNVEGLLGARYRFLEDFEVGAGVGPGMSRGLGTPVARGVFMLAYSPEQRPAPGDRDGDGIVDPKDACPDVPGRPSTDPTKNGCPPTDRDGDRIFDEDDACPDVPGLPSADPAKNGCPRSDRDGDTIADDDDACPLVFGVASPDPAKNGCPKRDRDNDGITDDEDACPDLWGMRSLDRATSGCPGDSDGDGFRDDKDACPYEKGPANADPTKNGCPRWVRVVEKEITISEEIQFAFDKFNIGPASKELLDEIADVILQHPDILKVEIEGHADSVGTEAYNKTLSRKRAEAIRKGLIARGVSADRLTAKGYGEGSPVQSNDTAEGRKQNRRSRFFILERTAPTSPPR